MLTRRAPLSALIGLLVMIGMSGCFGGSPTSTPTPSAKPSASPLFATDEEALAAATKAYADYLAVTNSIGKGGWKSVEPLADLVTDSDLAREAKSAAQFNGRKWVQIGDSTFDTVSLQRFDTKVVSLYLCIDATSADIVDESGASVVDQSQPGRIPLQVDLISASTAPPQLLVDRSVAWSGEDFC